MRNYNVVDLAVAREVKHQRAEWEELEHMIQLASEAEGDLSPAGEWDRLEKLLRKAYQVATPPADNAGAREWGVLFWQAATRMVELTGDLGEARRVIQALKLMNRVATCPECEIRRQEYFACLTQAFQKVQEKSQFVAYPGVKETLDYIKARVEDPT